MIIKKFVAKTESDATEEARRELGQGIVIMNVRPVKPEGFLSFMRPPRVEVTVALEDEPIETPTVARPALNRLNAGRTAAAAAEQISPARTQAVPQPIQPVAPVQQALSQPVPQPVRSREVTESERLMRATQEGTLPPLKVSGIEQARQRSTSGSREETQSRVNITIPATDGTRTAQSDQVGVLEEKINSIHSLLEERISGTGREEKTEDEVVLKNSRKEASEEQESNGEMLAFVKLLYNTLLSNEVDEIYANQLTDEVEKVNKPGLPLEYILANVYQKMVLKFGSSETIQPADSGPKAVFFIGPTGVGKTTTIAKIASELSVIQHRKVALLTVDTYRIAAAEQLKTYASILEIPFRVIYSVEEMKAAAADLKDYDFLLVDTSGHSMHNEEQRRNIKQFLNAFDGILPADVFLVLSATTKYRDLIDITDSYSEMTQYKLIFTKMDETAAAGNLYNIKLHTDAPMSYITNGQNVPDDIAVFDAQSVVKALLGGKKGLKG